MGNAIRQVHVKYKSMITNDVSDYINLLVRIAHFIYNLSVFNPQ
jgi:hypothetical protein